MKILAATTNAGKEKKEPFFTARVRAVTGCNGGQFLVVVVGGDAATPKYALLPDLR